MPAGKSIQKEKVTFGDRVSPSKIIIGIEPGIKKYDRNALLIFEYDKKYFNRTKRKDHEIKNQKFIGVPDCSFLNAEFQSYNGCK